MNSRLLKSRLLILDYLNLDFYTKIGLKINPNSNATAIYFSSHYNGTGAPGARDLCPRAGHRPGGVGAEPQLTKYKVIGSNPIAPVCRLGSRSIVDGV